VLERPAASALARGGWRAAPPSRAAPGSAIVEGSPPAEVRISSRHECSSGADAVTATGPRAGPSATISDIHRRATSVAPSQAWSRVARCARPVSGDVHEGRAA
jgi:hypothetical protein